MCVRTRTTPTGTALRPKGRAAPELLHSPARLTRPLRRTTPQGGLDPEWKEISWEEAMAEITERMAELRGTTGPESAAFSVTPPGGTPISDAIDRVGRFIHLYGSPNICHSTEMCNWRKDFAHSFTFGSAQPAPDFADTGLTARLGHNPAKTWLARSAALAEARARGARLAIIGPRRSAAATQAGHWPAGTAGHRRRPGTRAGRPLYALTGCYDAPGENVVLPQRSLARVALPPTPEQAGKALGLDGHSLGPPASGWVTARALCGSIIDGDPYRVRALVSPSAGTCCSPGPTRCARPRPRSGWNSACTSICSRTPRRGAPTSSCPPTSLEARRATSGLRGLAPCPAAHAAAPPHARPARRAPLRPRHRLRPRRPAGPRGRVLRGGDIHAHLACPARVPKPRGAGPGRPPGVKDTHRAPRYAVGKTVKHPRLSRPRSKPGRQGKSSGWPWRRGRRP
ncbi:molybdopterin-dependent oxidoreductase [Streptomyces javensis]|uniref:molybdopterin-dependent oxidoreductase n=1 Tax=Streptomyces javensis TaxID=114698 RepID=UPI003F4CE652